MLAVPVSLFGAQWVYFDACGVDEEIMGEWIDGPVKYVPAPHLRGYLVNVRAVTLIAEARHIQGLKCVTLIGVGGNAITVIGTMDEVKRKLGHE